MKDDNKSIIKEALTNYNEIKEAADANAKKRLADEFPDKFSSLLKEEINKNKKSGKESYKKLDDIEESVEDKTELNKESDMKTQEKETKKVVENVGNGKPFEKNVKKPEVVTEERDKDFVGDIESDTPNQGKGEGEKGVRFTEKIKGPTSGKPMPNLKEEFDITELDMSSVGSALDNASNEDEVLTMEQIEEEIASMEGLGEELNTTETSKPEDTDKGIAFNQLVGMRNQIDEMIKTMGHVPAEPLNQEGVSNENAQVEEIYETDEITDDDINAVLGSGTEQPVDETMSISNSAGTITPGKLGDHEGTHGRFRQDESKKKISGLINENKSLTKKLNEATKYKTSVNKLLEQYNGALEKYRSQLKEMAVFNTNLAHVNNLLVNESLALTQDDKIKIINEFKVVDSITESQKKYNTVLSEMKISKKTLTESIEDKVTTSIQPSSKQKLDEVVEKTAYADDKHIQKMRSLIEYVEKRGKKIIK